LGKKGVAMFRFGNKVKKKKFGLEIKLVKEEINRSERHDYNFGILVVNVSHSVPRGLSKIMPGRVISFHLMRKYIRNYDKLVGSSLRRYYIILSQTDRQGVNIVKQRIHMLAKKYNWGVISIGMAIFPEDCKTPQTLLDKAINNLSHF